MILTEQDCNSLSLELGENKDYLEEILDLDSENIANINLANKQIMVDSFDRDLKEYEAKCNGSKKEANEIAQYRELLNKTQVKLAELKRLERGKGKWTHQEED